MDGKNEALVSTGTTSNKKFRNSRKIKSSAQIKPTTFFNLILNRLFGNLRNNNQRKRKRNNKK